MRCCTPWARTRTGYIMYTPDGYMSVLMMAAGRTNFAAGDMLSGTDEEKLAAASTFIAYCGRYEYLGDRVIHNVETAFYPNRVGTEQVRYVHQDGDELILTTPPMVLAGKSREGRIVWQRAAAEGERLTVAGDGKWRYEVSGHESGSRLEGWSYNQATSAAGRIAG